MPRYKGVDVSEHQGKINWMAVKEDGIQFAIIRIGWTHYEGGITLDDRYLENIRGAQAAGIPIGAYVYGYDLNVEAAETSAKMVAKELSNYRFEYPVYYDQEYEPKLQLLTRQQRTDICRVFLETLQKNGYFPGIYASKDWFENWVFDSQLVDYEHWVAQYADTCSYSGTYGVWQYGVIGNKGVKGKEYTLCGSIAGIQTNCDLDFSYRDYPALIKRSPLNGWGKPPDKTPLNHTTLLTELKELLRKYGEL